MIDALSVALGLAFLFAGGEGLVRGSASVATRFNVSRLLISTFIIGFGTSMPELLVSIDAALSGYPQIALGNVIGSNISNILLVLGIAAIISQISCNSPAIKRDALIGVIATLFLSLLTLIGYLYRSIGIFMLVCLAIYVSYNIIDHRADRLRTKPKVSEYKNTPIAFAILMIIVSLILLPLGAHLLVNGAVSIATYFNISNAVIGLTLIAIGTSLPEIATALIASWRKQSDMVIGNILGSNLFNILMVLGMTSIIKPIPFEGSIARQDVWIMLAVSAVLFAIIALIKKIGRLEGVIFVALYVSYFTWLFS